MKKILTLLFIGLLNFTNHAFSDEKILSSLNEGKKLIFIRHAIAPGNGDPDNFNIFFNSKHFICIINEDDRRERKIIRSEQNY